MTETGDELCRCGHPNGEHTVTGECAIHRSKRARAWLLGECGCEQFTPRKQDMSIGCDDHDACEQGPCKFKTR